MRYRFEDGEVVRINNKNRFTHFLPKGHPEMDDLDKWRDWFLGRGINACVVEVAGKGFAVYRNGLRNTIHTEALRQKTKSASAPPKRGRPKNEFVAPPKTLVSRKRGRPKKQPVTNG